MSEVKDKLITAENLKNAYDDNKRAVTQLRSDLSQLSEEIVDKATLENGVIKFYKSGETDKELFTLDISSVGGSGGLDLNNLTLSISQVGEWSDGNPDGENRIGYFVCHDMDVMGINMRKVTSNDDVRGVTVTAPAFSGNCSTDKFDESGNLIPKYSYVAVMGIVPVIDDGSCVVGGRCMPNDNGTASAVAGDYGYLVMERIDETHVMIALEPGTDYQYHAKEEVAGLKSGLDQLKESCAGGGCSIELIAKVTTTENVAEIVVEGIDTDADVLSIRLYNCGDNCGNGLYMSINKNNYVTASTGTNGGNNVNYADTRAWLYKSSGKLLGKSIMKNLGMNTYDFGAAPETINSISIKSPYNDGESQYFQSGTIVEIYEGVFPNVT